MNAIGSLANGGSADAVVESISNMASGIASFIQNNAEGFAQTGASILISIVDGISTAADILIDPLVNAIDKAFANIPVDRLANSAGRLMGTIGRAVTAVLRSGSSIFGQLIPVIISAIPVFLSALLSNIDYHAMVDSVFLPFVDAVIDNLPDIIDALAYAVPLIVSTVLVDGLANAAPDIIDGMVNIAGSIVSSVIQSAIGIVVNMIPVLFNTVLSAVTGFGEYVISAIKGVLEQVEKVPGAISSILRGDATVEEAMSGFGNWLTDKISTANVSLDYTKDWIDSSNPAFSWEKGFTVSENRTKLSDFEKTQIDKVESNVFINSTNATPEEISDSVAEGMAIALQEFNGRKGATHGKKAIVAR